MPYSNAKIENLHTHIKALKRVAYGFRSFRKMKTRIFLLNNLITYESKTSKVEKEFYLRCSYLTLSVLFDKEPFVLHFNISFSSICL
nr:transposase [Enterococcus faecium]